MAKHSGPEYRTWHTMKQRCQTPTATSYHNYGGRGITVCERWQIFENFLEDMGPKPSPYHSLDRVDNSCGYAPGNVMWALPEQQHSNKRTNRKLTWNGLTLTVSQWADRIGIKRHVLYHRVTRGWTPERTLTAAPLSWRRP